MVFDLKSRAGASARSIDQSVRVNAADSAHWSWTPGTAGNRRTFTFHARVKRGNLTGANQCLMSAGGDDWIMFLSAETLGINTDATGNYRLVSSALFRDTTNWLDITINCDTTLEIMHIWVNGVEVTNYATETTPLLNYETAFNNTTLHYLGRLVGGTAYFDGELADVHWIDGVAYDASYFGEFDPYYPGFWRPIVFKSFTRNTIGTYEDSAGVIRTAAIDVPRINYTGGVLDGELAEASITNYIHFSEDTSNGVWNVGGTTAVTAGNLTGPDGLVNSADTITVTGGTNNTLEHQLRTSNSRALEANTDYIFSGWIKLLTGSFAADGNLVIKSYGSVATVANMNIGSDVDATWQRFYALLTTDGSPSANHMQLRADEACTLGVFGWQVEKDDGSGLPTSYVPSLGAANTSRGADLRNEARYGENGFHLEFADANDFGLDSGSTENLVYPSDDFSNARWSAIRMTKGTVGTELGFATQEMVEDNTSGTHIVEQSWPAVSGQVYRASIIAEATGRDYMYFTTNALTTTRTFFNLTTGAVGTVGAGHTASITDMGGGVYRCDIVFTATGTGNKTFDYGAGDADNSHGYTGNSASATRIYGAQVASGSVYRGWKKTTAAVAVANDITPSGLTTTDQLADTPTNNYPVLNVAHETVGGAVAISNGGLNLTGAASTSWCNAFATFGLSTASGGKYIWASEVTLTGQGHCQPFVVNENWTKANNITTSANAWGMTFDSTSNFARYDEGTASVHTMSPVAAALDYNLCAIDLDNMKIWFGWYDVSADAVKWADTGTGFTGDPGANSGGMDLDGSHFRIGFSSYSGRSGRVDFGQSDLLSNITLPTGFTTLSANNLPDPVVKDNRSEFVTVTDTEANIIATLAAARSGWTDYVDIFKNRDAIESYYVRWSADPTNCFNTDDTGAKETFPTLAGSGAWLGCSMKLDGLANIKAGSVSHTNGADTTVTHNAGNARALIILFHELGGSRHMYHPSLTSGKLVYLDATTVETTDAAIKNVTANAFDIDTGEATDTIWYLVIPETEGFFDLSEYEGNGLDEGPFIHMNGKPSLYSSKRISGSAGGHYTWNDQADPENQVINQSQFNDPAAETSTANNIDFLAAGVKVRDATGNNVSGAPYLTWAFLSEDFKHSNAR